MKTLVKKVLKRFGFERRGAVGAEFVLYRYLKPDGSFDYEKYRAIQERGNKEKIDWVWVVEENIAFLADYIQKHLQGVQFGICHGTRRGKEQEWFRKYLGCEVIGTELSETATSFPNTIQWDFHKVKPEWLNSVDFIYSNSFDHSYDPEQCLNTWVSCLKKGGFCILEHTSFHTAAATSELDPFGADLVQMPYLIAKWGKGSFAVREILDAPAKRPENDYTVFLIIQKF